jgi:hypothetical protein
MIDRLRNIQRFHENEIRKYTSDDTYDRSLID